MKIPIQKAAAGRQTVFYKLGGLDRRLKAEKGHFRNMVNMCGDEKSCLAARGARSFPELDADTIYSAVTADIYIDGVLTENAFICDTGSRLTAFYERDGQINSTAIMNTVNFTQGANRMLVSGGYLYFFPDKKYINLMNTDEKGSLEAEIQLETAAAAGVNYEVCFESCNADGTQAQENSGYLRILRYTLLEGGTRGAYLNYANRFSSGDTVEISGCTHSSLNGSYTVRATGLNYIVIDGTEAVTENSGTPVRIRRHVPDMDYVVACGNRLWGCRYGTDDNGKPLNEIYASALGDAKNWNSFEGTAMDSYAASIGAEGVFTGAAVYDGKPLFFKEDAVIKVFGSTPSEFTVLTDTVRGIEKGSAGSAALVNDVLYYKTHSGIIAYNGGIPVNIDSDLGGRRYSDATGGSCDGKYYISAKNSDGKYELLVYDTASGEWFMEDETQAESFERCGSRLYMLEVTDSGRRLVCLTGGVGAAESAPGWMCETGDIGCEVPQKKYISRVNIGLRADFGARVYVEIQYDGDGKWHTCASKKASGRFTVRLHPRSCDFFSLRISGRGSCTVCSISVWEHESEDM